MKRGVKPGTKFSAEHKRKISEFAKTRTAEKNPFFGKAHSEETKQKICLARTGVVRDSEERAGHRKGYKEKWFSEHPEKVKQYDARSLRPRAEANARRRKKLRLSIIEALGSRCSSSSCRWMNEDGSFGCSDVRILHIDHVHGGGTKERNSTHPEAMYRMILKNPNGYQLLCPNCNWLKALRNKEFVRKYEEGENAALRNRSGD